MSPDANFVDELRGMRGSIQSAWLQFDHVYRKGCLDVYLFVEGWPDLSFYLHHVRQRWSPRGQVHGFNCRGKDNVVAIIPRVRPKLDLSWRALFFIDKDVDDFCGCAPPKDKYMYETECYAIENFVVCAACITVIWTDLLGMQATDQTLTKVIQRFEHAQREFYKAMRRVMAFAIHARREGQKVVFNDVSIKKVVTLDEDCVANLIAGWDDHIVAASNMKIAAGDLDAVAVGDVEAEIGAGDPQAFVRGKFDVWFFAEFVRKIVSAFTEKISGQPRQTLRVPITADSAIDVLAPRLPPPASLQTFLSSVLPP